MGRLCWGGYRQHGRWRSCQKVQEDMVYRFLSLNPLNPKPCFLYSVTLCSGPLPSLSRALSHSCTLARSLSGAGGDALCLFGEFSTVFFERVRV